MRYLKKSTLPLIFFPVAFVLMSASCDREHPSGANGKKAAQPSFQDRRADFQTTLLREGPSPQRFKQASPPPGVKEVFYDSGDLQLKAWVSAPESSSDTKLPAVIYYHGGYAFGAGDFEDCRPFIDAGMVVMTPMLRGENGNPGNFEMYFGEVDDARAALLWLAMQDNVDSERIYAFGHSAGGVISALLSLYAEPSLRFSGSSGGLYGPSLFVDAYETPFDVRNEQETSLRCLVGNIKDMKSEHIAFVGSEDDWQEVRQAKAELADSPGKLQIRIQKGDHFSILPTSVESFLDEIEADIGAPK